MLCVVVFKDWSKRLKEEYNSEHIICPEEEGLERNDTYYELAQVDQEQEADAREGLMHCYCKAVATRTPERLLDEGLPECLDWAVNQGI